MAEKNPFIQTVLIYYVSKIESKDVVRLAKYDVLDLNRFNYKDVGGNTWKAIKALNPSVKIYLYQLGPEVADNHDTSKQCYLNNISRYRKARGHLMAIDTAHRKFFLLDASGKRINNPAYPHCWLLNFGLSAFQKYWVEATTTDIVNQSWKGDGIFVDNCIPAGKDANPFGGSKPVIYKSESAWNSAMNAFVNAVTASLRKRGQKVFTNRGMTRYQAGFDAWLALDRSAHPPDMVMEEGAFAVRWGNKNDVQFYPEKDWMRQVNVVGRLQNSRVALLSHTDLSPENPVGKDNYGQTVTFWQTLWYAMCSYHLARKDTPNNAYFMFSGPGKRIWWFDEYDKIDLGKAIGTYQVKKIGGVNVYFREFEKGYIYVNPTLKDAPSVPLPMPCVQITHETINRDPSSLPTTEKIAIPSHHGVIVVKVLEKTLSPPSNVRLKKTQ